MFMTHLIGSYRVNYTIINSSSVINSSTTVLSMTQLQYYEYVE